MNPRGEEQDSMHKSAYVGRAGDKTAGTFTHPTQAQRNQEDSVLSKSTD